jgi:hypothetical protein
MQNRMQNSLSRRHALAALGAGAASLALPDWLGFAAQAQSSPWRLLFDGHSFDGWQFYQHGVGFEDVQGLASISDGNLHFLGPSHSGAEAKPGYLATVEEYGNYHLRFDYRWGANRYAPRRWSARNSGLLYHMTPHVDGRHFPPCVEMQMMEGNCGDAILIDTLGLHGPSLGGWPLWPNWIPAFPQTYAEPVSAGGYARQNFARHMDYEADGWNTVDLIAFDDQAAHLVNGRIVNTLFALRNPQADVPLTRGRIGLEFEWAEIVFRNVMIRDLSAEAIANIRANGSD